MAKDTSVQPLLIMPNSSCRKADLSTERKKSFFLFFCRVGLALAKSLCWMSTVRATECEAVTDISAT